MHVYEEDLMLRGVGDIIDARKIRVKLLVAKALARRASQSSSCPVRD
jgi:hypothetical protein